MPSNFYFLFSFLFIISSCVNDSSSPIIFQGQIGDFKAEIMLFQKGDKFEGTFKYLDIDKPSIQINGILDQNTLILHEFNSQNNLSGTFKGKYDSKSYKGSWVSPNKKKKIHFFFDLINLDQKSNSKTTNSNEAISLKPKDLIQIFFNPEKIKTNKSAYYSKEGANYLVKYNDIEYLYDKTQALVFFSNYPADNEGNLETYHVSAGFVSAARLKFENNKWYLIYFSHYCCGSASWGEATVPKIEKIGSEYFLYEESGYVGQGHYIGGQSYYEIDNFKSVISASEEDNSGAVGNSPERFSFSSKIKLFEENDIIKAKVTYEGTNYIKEEDKIIDVSREEFFYYDKSKPLFMKEK